MINLNQKISDKKVNLSPNPLILQYELDEAISEENAKTFQKYRQAAEQGEMEAQYQLGLMYQQGQGVPQDDALAINWFRRAAEQGQLEAQNQLGLFYQSAPRESVPDDQAGALAKECFSDAAEQGHAEAQYNLGLLYKVGKGVSQDYTQARYWFNLAAEQGHSPAQNMLRLMPPIPMTDRRLFLLLSAIGLTSSFFTLTGCGDRCEGNHCGGGSESL
jgi:hypothetical protein